MKRFIPFSLLAGLLFSGLTNVAPLAAHAEAASFSEEETKTIRVLDSVTLTVPANWKTQPTKSRIVEHEFSVTLGEGEDTPTGRITLMAAGGDIPANIARWEGQFSQGEKAKIEKKEVAGQIVHFVQLSGTFKETMGGGPFAGGKTVMRENYGMLGAIIEAKNGGKYFIKLTGPQDVIEANLKPFKEMLDTMKE